MIPWVMTGDAVFQLLWVIPVGWLQWLLVVVGAVLSGSALLLTFWPAIREDKKQVRCLLLEVLGFSFMKGIDLHWVKKCAPSLPSLL